MATITELEKLSLQLNTAVASVLAISNTIHAELLRAREAGEEIPATLSTAESASVLVPTSDPVPPAAPVVAHRTRRSHADVVAAAAAKQAQPHTDGRSARWAKHRAQVVADIDAGIRSRPVNWTEEDLIKYRAEAAAANAADASVSGVADTSVEVPDNGLLSPIEATTPAPSSEVSAPVVPAVSESEPENPDVERIVDQF